MKHFSSFVFDETTLVNDPIFSRDAVQEYVQTPDKRYDRKHDKKYDRRNKYGNFATKGGEVEVKCSLCEGNHDLDDCSSFLQFELQERSKWLYNNKLCYGCLNAISVNHNARNCKNRRNAKFVRKGIQHLCMVIEQRKVRKNSLMVSYLMEQMHMLTVQQLRLNLILLVCV